MSSEKTAERKLSVYFIIFIILIPYIGAWFTLRDGYSKKSRYLSMGYMIFALIFLTVNPEQSADSDSSDSQVATTVSAEYKCDVMFQVEDKTLASNESFCALQQELLNDKYQFHLNFLDSELCKLYQDLVIKLGSRADLKRVMTATYNSTSNNKSKQANIALSAYTHCENQQTKNRFINKMLDEIKIYSFGSFALGNLACEGLLVQEGMNAKDSSLFYHLFSVGECANINFDGVFHPVNNPNGKAYSSILNELNYTGSIPSYWYRHGSKYQF
jgi:hypothetical protein